jgi:hypothetical protein
LFSSSMASLRASFRFSKPASSSTSAQRQCWAVVHRLSGAVILRAEEPMILGFQAGPLLHKKFTAARNHLGLTACVRLRFHATSLVAHCPEEQVVLSSCPGAESTTSRRPGTALHCHCPISIQRLDDSMGKGTQRSLLVVD